MGNTLIKASETAKWTIGRTALKFAELIIYCLEEQFGYLGEDVI